MYGYLGSKVILFYYLIKWKLINLLIIYLFKNQNLFLTRKYVSQCYTIGSSILKIKDFIW